MFIAILFGLHSIFSYIPLIIIILPIFIYLKIWKVLLEDMKEFFSSIKSIRFNKIEIFCIFLLIIEFIYLFLYWLIYPIYLWDAMVIWDARAKFIYYDGNFDYLNSFERIYEFHHSYPLLVPLNLVFFYSIMFQYHYFAKILFASYFIFLITFIFHTLRSFNLSRTYSMLISTMVALLGNLFFHATIAYADLTITFFYTISTILLFCYIYYEKQHFLLYSSIFMGFTAWSKIEGIALFGINVIILIIYQVYKYFRKEIAVSTSLKRLSIYLLITITIYLPWQIFLIVNNIPSEFITELAILFDFETSFSDLSVILDYILTVQFFDFLSWGSIYWLVFYIILILNFRTLLNEKIIFLFLFLVGHFILYIIIYIITPLELEWHLAQSIDRELLHLAPLSGFLIGAIISEKMRKQPKDFKDTLPNNFLLFN